MGVYCEVAVPGELAEGDQVELILTWPAGQST